MIQKKNKAIFLDQDGTLIQDRHYLSDPDKIRIYPGVIPSLKKLKAKGWKLIVGTNQSGIGRGYFTARALKQVHQRLLSIFRKHNLLLDDIFFCPHHPSAGCNCRKPESGMLRKAARRHLLNLKECYVIGDKESDILWGKRAGAKAILVLTGYGKEHRSACAGKADHIARSLPSAVEWILKQRFPSFVRRGEGR